MPDLFNSGQPFLNSAAGDLGLSPHGLVTAVRDGDLSRLFSGVYVDARSPDSRDLRVAAAKLVVPSHAVVADETAAWLWGVDVHRPSDRHRFVPRWMVPHGESRARLDGLDCRQALIAPGDVVDLHGLAVTRPVRTAADLLRKQWRPHAMASADALARMGLIVGEDVESYVAALKGYRGVRQARVLARYIEPKAASAGESWLRLRLIDAGFPRPEAQLEVVDVAGVVRRLDLAYRKRRVAVEYDGREFHTADPDSVHDDDRRGLLAARGFTFVLARYEDVFGTDDRLERDLGALLGIRPIPRWW